MKNIRQLIIPTILLLISVCINAQMLDGTTDFELQFDVAQTTDSEGNQDEPCEVKSSVTFKNSNDLKYPKKGTLTISSAGLNFSIDILNVKVEKPDNITFYVAVSREYILVWTSFSFDMTLINSKKSVRFVNNAGLHHAYGIE